MTDREAALFFRLLKTPIDNKGDALAAQIAALNQDGEADEAFSLTPADFALIPGSPFAYWAGDSIRGIFEIYPGLEGEQRTAKAGLCTGDDTRFLRTWWEIPPQEIVGRDLAPDAEHGEDHSNRSYRLQTDDGERWALFAKGGQYSPFYADPHLVVNWENDGEEIRQGASDGSLPGARPQNIEFFFRSGLTWPLRTTSGMSTRALPAGCIFGHKGPSVFVPIYDAEELLAVLAAMNSALFERLVKLQLGAATAAARSYEVGIIQRTPIPPFTDEESRAKLAALAREAHDRQRDRDRSDETSHAFCLPGLAYHRQGSLLEAGLALEAEEQSAQARLAAIQAEIDDPVFDLYRLNEADRALIRAEMGASQVPTDYESRNRESEDDLKNQEAPSPPHDLPAHVQNLLMWCLGVAFGRWDVRFALDPNLLPPLPGPFDRLPRCAPGALIGPDGLPASRPEDIAPEESLRARDNVLDLPEIDDLRFAIDGGATSQSPMVNPQSSIAWDGILVDDPTHPADIVTRVRAVLALLWGERADAFEREACDVLGVQGLRHCFRDPRQGFFPFHIKRYSKSRRKAPIYWPLQSGKRNYAIWLYYHRLTPNTLFAAGRDYADAKVALEKTRLEDLRPGLAALDGSSRRQREREIERQQALADEVTAFRDQLDAVALLNLKPDLNDGVLITIAPLWQLVPWKEAQRTWDKLVSGEYEWSAMAQQMREEGLARPGE